MIKPPKIEAICEYGEPTDSDLFTIVGDLRTIPLSITILELNPRDQLLVLRSCMKTHIDLFPYTVPAFGKVLYYEVTIPDPEKGYDIIYLFDRKTNLMEDE